MSACPEGEGPTCCSSLRRESRTGNTGLYLDYTVLQRVFLDAFLFMIGLMHLKRSILQFSTLKYRLLKMIRSLIITKNKENCWEKVNLWLKMTQKAHENDFKYQLCLF